ncbi:site-specific DNA-methyltransferase [Romboutsia sp. 1001713B170131_170501_G6]|nr:site-specific DNA-methyltransferase [Romboutsia sp. 1001713B170131_170501_G6]
MESGSTGVACATTNRRFVEIELDNTYFEIAKNRIEKSYMEE